MYTVHYEYFIELLHVMSPQSAFNYMNFPLFCETDLNHLSIQFSKIMEQDRVKRKPFSKQFSDGKAIYYNKETNFCFLSEATVLNLETMVVIYAVGNNASIRFLII